MNDSSSWYKGRSDSVKFTRELGGILLFEFQAAPHQLQREPIIVQSSGKVNTKLVTFCGVSSLTMVPNAWIQSFRTSGSPRA
jgi:hypothetical protein